MLERLFPNSDVVFWLGDSSYITAYDCYNQRTFNLNEEYFSRLRFWDGSSLDERTSIDNELLAAGLLLSEEKNEFDWQGDRFSYLSHRGSRVSQYNSAKIEEVPLTKEMLKLASTRKIPTYYRFTNCKEIKLPNADLSDLAETSLLDAFKNRKTSRNFDGTPISMEILSNLLSLNFSHHLDKWQDEPLSHCFVNGKRTIAPS